MDLKEFRQLSNTNPIQKFSDDVEFSAACRQFYHSRRLAAEAVKEKLAVSGRQGKHRQTPVDTAIETLRTQIVSTVKPVYNRHSKKDQNWVSRTNYRLMQVKTVAECSKGSILQYFRPSLRYHLSLRSLFCLFLSGRFIPLFHTGPESHELTRIDKYVDSWLSRTQFVKILTDSHSP